MKDNELYAAYNRCKTINEVESLCNQLDAQGKIHQAEWVLHQFIKDQRFAIDENPQDEEGKELAKTLFKQ